MKVTQKISFSVTQISHMNFNDNDYGFGFYKNFHLLSSALSLFGIVCDFRMYILKCGCENFNNLGKVVTEILS